jgi:hypothetical protein
MSITLQFNVDADEIVDEASKRERQKLLIELLKVMDDEDVISIINHINNAEIKYYYTIFVKPSYSQTPMETEHNEALMNLSRRYMVMSKEDCDTIINISKKY